jgi:uncharacterized protein YraI
MLPSPDPSGRFSFLRSPVVFGGALLVVGVVVGVVVALTFAGGGDGGEATPGVRVDLTASPVPAEEGETPTTAGVTGKATAATSVRSGPGSNYQALGTIPRDKEVEIIGTSEDGEWLEVYFLPPSKLTGWVSSALLEVEGDLSGIPVSTPEAFAVPEVPTTEAPVSQPTEAPTESVPTDTPEPSPSATVPPEMPDLVISGAPVQETTLIITVTNQGGGELEQRLVQIGVFDARDSRLLRTVNAGPFTLAPGQSIDIPTGYDIRGGPARLLVIVDPQGQIEESDDTNNRLIFTVTAATPSPTSIPTATPPPVLPTATPTPMVSPEPGTSPTATPFP